MFHSEILRSIVFLAFQTFSPGLEKNEISKCGSEIFPHTVTYILRVENCQNLILMHSCLPIPGRPFQNVKTLHGLRISEWNLYKFIYTTQMFQCEVAVQHNPPELQHTVSIRAPPSISSSSPASITVEKGQDVTLSCKGSGSPRPSIKWTRVVSTDPNW